MFYSKAMGSADSHDDRHKLTLLVESSKYSSELVRLTGAVCVYSDVISKIFSACVDLVAFFFPQI